MPSSYASFDFLFLTEELSLKLGTAILGEIHLFAYLACLLSLLEGQPVAGWGYSFAGLELGSPFSPDLQDAYTELERAGFVANNDNYVGVTVLGKQQTEIFNTLEAFTSRKRYLSAACSSLLSFPVGIVRNAMSMEPGLRPVSNVGGTRPLLATASLEQLHDQFNALIKVLGKTSDLLVPSTVWLTYLFELSSEHDQTRSKGYPGPPRVVRIPPNPL
jgi:hypothetical protein